MDHKLENQLHFIKLRLNALEGAVELLLRATHAWAPPRPDGPQDDPKVKEWADLRQSLDVGIKAFGDIVSE